MNIYHVKGYIDNGFEWDHFSYTVRAHNEERARQMVQDALKEDPDRLTSVHVGFALEGDTDETIIW